jgi:drug/metabolite transporter (DMT)-like permease
MPIEWAHALTAIFLLFAFAFGLEAVGLTPLPTWTGILVAIPAGLFVWIAPMFFWNFVYRRMGWSIPPDDDENSN